MSFLDKMKKKAEELELDKKAKDLQAAATTAAKQAREKAGDFTAENRDKIDGYVEKAATTIDTKTDGKYADKVAKAKQHVGKGVDKVAEGSPTHPRDCTRCRSQPWGLPWDRLCQRRIHRRRRPSRSTPRRRAAGSGDAGCDPATASRGVTSDATTRHTAWAVCRVADVGRMGKDEWT